MSSCEIPPMPSAEAPLQWITDLAKQPEDGSYRVVSWRQRSSCYRFAVEKSRNAHTGATHFSAWAYATDPDAPVQWLGTYDSGQRARERCEEYRRAFLQPQRQERAA